MASAFLGEAAFARLWQLADVHDDIDAVLAEQRQERVDIEPFVASIPAPLQRDDQNVSICGLTATMAVRPVLDSGPSTTVKTPWVQCLVTNQLYASPQYPRGGCRRTSVGRYW